MGGGRGRWKGEGAVVDNGGGWGVMIKAGWLAGDVLEI